MLFQPKKKPRVSAQTQTLLNVSVFISLPPDVLLLFQASSVMLYTHSCPHSGEKRERQNKLGSSTHQKATQPKTALHKG